MDGPLRASKLDDALGGDGGVTVGGAAAVRDALSGVAIDEDDDGGVEEDDDEDNADGG